MRNEDERKGKSELRVKRVADLHAGGALVWAGLMISGLAQAEELVFG